MAGTLEGASGARLRPAPVLTAENEFFWRGAAEGKLLCHRSAVCGRLRAPTHTPVPALPPNDWNLVELSGRGTVASFIIIHHPPNPWFDLPIVAGTIDLEEGVQVISNICDIDPHAVRLGMPVQAFFAATEDDLAVPLFRPA